MAPRFGHCQMFTGATNAFLEHTAPSGPSHRSRTFTHMADISLGDLGKALPRPRSTTYSSTEGRSYTRATPRRLAGYGRAFRRIVGRDAGSLVTGAIVDLNV